MRGRSWPSEVGIWNRGGSLPAYGSSARPSNTSASIDRVVRQPLERLALGGRDRAAVAMPK